MTKTHNAWARAAYKTIPDKKCKHCRYCINTAIPPKYNLHCLKFRPKPDGARTKVDPYHAACGMWEKKL